MLRATVTIPCPVCGSEDREHLGHTLSGRVIGVRTPISICRSCGFVFVCPRWTREQYDAVMDLWYPHKFELDPEQRLELSAEPGAEDLRFRKWRVMDERIHSYYPQGVRRLLDVGAGQGWCIEYLKRKYPSRQACAVERWPDAQRNIEQRYGARIIGSDIDGEWDKGTEGSFDLVVFRHTLEHILDPKPVLEQIRRHLSADGLAYIVVPSLRGIRRPLFHNWFRPVHVSYFCGDTLESLARQAGLEPVVMEERGSNEVWALFRRGESSFRKPDTYTEIKGLLEELRTRQRLEAMRRSARIQYGWALHRTGLRSMLRRLRSRSVGHG